MSKGGSGGTKKYGRNADKCKQYKAEGRRERNKARIAKKVAREAEKKLVKLASREEDRRISAALSGPVKA